MECRLILTSVPVRSFVRSSGFFEVDVCRSRKRRGHLLADQNRGIEKKRGKTNHASKETHTAREDLTQPPPFPRPDAHKPSGDTQTPFIILVRWTDTVSRPEKGTHARR
mmetsp:Transcript_14675/g.29616  ORF Transcript_14675/g.29616 Transcript_14675/m.29616 type:complete len:109 (-) Transcript_14675:1192-1518(-)